MTTVDSGKHADPIREPWLSPLRWDDNLPPLVATPEVGAVQSDDAARILGEMITEHRLNTVRGAAFSASFRSAPVGPMRVIFQRYDAFAGIDITEPLGVVAMTIPLAGDLAVLVDGREYVIPRGSPLVFNPGSAPRMLGPSTASFLTVTLPADYIATQLELHFPKVTTGDAIAFGTKASRQSAGALAHAMWQVQDALSRGILHAPEQQERAAETLVSSLLLSHPHSHTRELYESGRKASDAAVWDAVALLRAAPQDRITVAEIAASSGIGMRSLQLGFERLLGVSPSEFQRDLRLELARQIIRDSRGGLAVTQVSTSVGFVNGGRFAADYRRRFGMSPSAEARDARS